MEAGVEPGGAVARPAGNVSEFLNELGLEVPAEVLDSLHAAQITTLEDLRAAGGTGDLGDGMSGALKEALDAAAVLSVITPEPALTARLVAAGLVDLAGVAAAPSETLGAALEGLETAPPGDELRTRARLESEMAANTLAGMRVDARHTADGTGDATLDGALRRICGCRDCQNAVSPLAYLADLLAYTVRHLRIGGAAIGPLLLGERLHQPLYDLPVACESLDLRVRQVRIAIEVLRAETGLDTASPGYLDRTYAMLLDRLGTSFAELRAAATAAAPVRRALGDRLGIDVPDRAGTAAFDPLEVLLLHPAASAGPVTEQALEDRFGLQATTSGDPFRPDTVSLCMLHGWRMQRLRDTWRREDWPSTAPSGMRPLIDPDQLGPSDFADPSSVVAQIFQDREIWIAGRIGAKRDARVQMGYDAMLQESSVSGLPPQTSLQDLFDLDARRSAGQTIDAEIEALGLQTASFDELVRVGRLDQAGAPILAAEWTGVYSLLTQIEKRAMFSVWRLEEQQPNPNVPGPAGYFPITLTDRYFRPRLAPSQGGYSWTPDRWRSDPEARRRWVTTLRVRIEREAAVTPALSDVVDAVEAVRLPELRDELLVALWNRPRPPGVTDVDEWFARRFLLEPRAGGSLVTTRVAQAIQSVQGLLYGARYGLLVDSDIALEADAFDAEWHWIGSYATWRAAMLVFLYPESVLRPTMRRQQTPGFTALVARLRAAGRVGRDEAEAAAHQYSSYFADASSLRAVALRYARSLSPYRAATATEPAQFTRRLLALGRADSGRLYFSRAEQIVRAPALGGTPVVLGTLEDSFWTEVAGAPVGAELEALVPYQSEAIPQVALYLRERRPGGDVLTFLNFATAWSAARGVDEIPALVRAAEYVSEVPPAAGFGLRSDAGPLRGDDRIVAADLDGDGAREIVVVAAAEPAGGRRVAVLREQDGGLATAWTGALPLGWDLPAGDPVVLRISPISGLDRVVLVNVGTPALGLFGGVGSGFGLTTTTTTGWPVNAAANLVAADLDGNGADELVAVESIATGEWFNPTRTSVTVLGASDAGLVARDTETLVTDDPARIYVGPAGTDRSEGFDLQWERFVAVRELDQGGNPRVALLASSTRTERVFNTQQTVQRLGLFHWDAATGMLTDRLTPGQPRRVHVGGVPNAADPNQPGWVLQTDDRLLPLRLTPGAPRDSVVAASAAGATAVLRPTSGGRLEMTWLTPGPLAPATAVATAAGWTRAGTDRLLTADLDGDRREEILLVAADGSRVAVVGPAADGSLVVRWSDVLVRVPGGDRVGWNFTADSRVLAADIDGDGQAELVAIAGQGGGQGRIGVLRGLPRRRFPAGAGQPTRFGPRGVVRTAIRPKGVGAAAAQEQNASRADQAAAYAANASPGDEQNLAYLDEAYWAVPVELALRLAASGDLTGALDWLASVYDFARPVADRKIARRLVIDETTPGSSFARAADWLRDPLDGHAIAATRRNAFTRFTILTIVSCLNAAADAEFARGTGEAVQRASELYRSALRLLQAPELTERSLECSDLLGSLEVTVGEGEWIPLVRTLASRLEHIGDIDRLRVAVEGVRAALSASGPFAQRLAAATSLVDEALVAETPPPMSAVLENDARLRRIGERFALARRLDVPGEIDGDTPVNGASAADLASADVTGRWVPAPSFAFCIPPSPASDGLRRHAQLGLDKIRSGRNIAGARTRLDPYAQAGLGAGTDRGAAADFPPLPYRYPTLLERARELTRLAGQIELAMLNSLQAGVAAAYTELSARQDLQLARAGVRLKDLQVMTAQDEVGYADAQTRRVAVTQEHFNRLIAGGVSTYEQLGVAALQARAALGFASGIATLVEGDVGQGFSRMAEGAGSQAQVFQTLASFEAREREWRYQRSVADADARVADAQGRLAGDGLAVARQDRAIAALQTDHAEEVLDFLTNRSLLGADLYEWMSDVLGGVYRFLLQQATSMAQAAELGLAFERQRETGGFIQPDYWKPPSEMAPALAPRSGGASDLRGLTGAERLLRDLVDLDEFAFRTDQRRLQLTRSISVSRLDPFAFEEFRRTGVLTFSTTEEMFSRDFPDHYLRLIHRVRASVVAIVPPGDGIRATLATTGLTRTVVGGDVFTTVVVPRAPESVALSSPLGASGTFELDPQPQVLSPFEGLGVDASWQFTLPRASNQIDFGGIADVVVRFDYTALASPDRGAEVMSALEPRRTADRVISLRRELQDPWWELHNPDQARNMVVSFRVERDDFPPNLDGLAIRHLAVYFAAAQQTPAPGWSTPLATRLRFRPDDGAAFLGDEAIPVDGLMSTRNFTAANWGDLTGAPPVGEWEIALRDQADARALFSNESVLDVLFAITYEGDLPPWPDAS